MFFTCISELLSQPLWLKKDNITHWHNDVNTNKEKFKSSHIKSQTQWYVSDTTKPGKIIVEKYLYDLEGRLIQRTQYNRTSNAEMIYLYDAAGNVVCITTLYIYKYRGKIDTTFKEIEKLTYDSMNRFTSQIILINDNEAMVPFRYFYNDVENSIMSYNTHTDNSIDEEYNYFNSDNFLIRKESRHGRCSSIQDYNFHNDTLTTLWIENDKPKFTLYDIFNQYGKPVKRIREYTDSITVYDFEGEYDQNGLLIKYVQYDEGKLSHYLTYTYDIRRNLIQENYFIAKNGFTIKDFTYNDYGFVTSERESKQGYSKNQEIHIYTYEYY